MNALNVPDKSKLSPFPLLLTKAPNSLMTSLMASLLAATLTLAACAGSQKKGDAEKAPEADLPAARKSSPSAGASIEAKQVAASEQAPYVTELTFAKGLNTLNKANKARISKILSASSASGSIEAVKVISWADSEYPSVHQKKLSEDARKLAEQRSTTVKNFVDQELKKKTSNASPVTVEAYNMAERPGMLKEIFQSDDARIKTALEVAGIPNTDTSVKNPAKASKAIVMILLKR